MIIKSLKTSRANLAFNKIFLLHKHFCESLKNFRINKIEDMYDDDELKFLENKKLKIVNEKDNIKTIKKLIEENKALDKDNNRLRYRIEHLLRTIKEIENKSQNNN